MIWAASSTLWEGWISPASAARESFDKDLEEEFSQRSFDSWLDALRAVIYRQTNGADIVGAALEARIFQAQLNTHGGYVVVEDRFFPVVVEVSV